MLEVERRRPLDTLAGLLAERNHANLEDFFKSYGDAEASSMCFQLVTSEAVSIPAVSKSKVRLVCCWSGSVIQVDLG